jgi:hypothetical protein
VSEFAKLYGAGDDQILVKLDSDDECNPEIRFYFVPPGLGVASVAITFKYRDDADEREAWELADKAFAKVDEAAAMKMRDGVLEQLNLPDPPK